MIFIFICHIATNLDPLMQILFPGNVDLFSMINDTSLQGIHMPVYDNK